MLMTRKGFLRLPHRMAAKSLHDPYPDHALQAPVSLP